MKVWKAIPAKSTDQIVAVKPVKPIIAVSTTKLVIITIDNFLIRNDIFVRPYAREFLQYLYSCGAHLAFYTVAPMVRGPKYYVEKIMGVSSINSLKGITIINGKVGSTTTLIDKINERTPTKPKFIMDNTIVLDDLATNKRIRSKIPTENTVYIPGFVNSSDSQLAILIHVFYWYQIYQSTEKIADYVSSTMDIIDDVYTSALI